MDRRELFRNALGAAAGVVVPGLWLPSLMAPKPAAAEPSPVMLPGEGRHFLSILSYQGESFLGIDQELRELWRRTLVPATMVMTSRQILDMVHLAEREGSIIRATAPAAERAPEAIYGVGVTGYKHPVTGEIVKVHGRLAQCRDEVWFTSERRDTLCWDEPRRTAPIAAGEPWVEGKNFEYR